MTSISTMLVIPFFISYILITYIKSLEYKKCDCSTDIRRKYIKYYGYFILVLSIISLFILAFAFTYPKLIYLNTIIRYFSLFITSISVYIMYTYSDILENNECNCADSWKKIFIKYYSYIMLILLAITFFSLLLIFIFHILSGNDFPIKTIRNSLKSC